MAVDRCFAGAFVTDDDIHIAFDKLLKGAGGDKITLQPLIMLSD